MNDIEDGSTTLDITFIVVASIIGIILLLILIRLFEQGPFYWKKNRIDGKVVIITGSNTGIGKETALELAKRGGKIYMACRDSVKCEAARLEIIQKTKNENIFNRTLDLSSLDSIRKFVTNFLQEESRLDILINNAGVMACPKSQTKDGFEIQIGVNHLGHFLLTNLLLDRLKASAPSRIVVVSSMLYATGKIKKNDLNSEKSYDRWESYSQSKLANILFTKQLAKILDGTGVTVNCLHPGAVDTELHRHVANAPFIRNLKKPFISMFCKSTRAGAQTSIRLAIDPVLDKVSGNFYLDTYIRFPLLPKARNMETAEWLWKRSMELVGLKDSSTEAADNNETTVVEINSTKE